MLVDAKFLINDPQIIQGLLDGTLTRFGGVIRETGTGQIVKHLVESPELTKKLIGLAPNPIAGGAALVGDAIGHGITIHKLNQVQQTLSSVLQVSQIAAGASVLNLGVSLIGFAYMGYKLHQMQKSINTLQHTMEAGFDRIDNRLDQLAGQLAYIQLLVEENRQGQQQLGQAIAELHRAVLIKELADLQAELLNRDRYPDSPIQPIIKVASRVRMVLAHQVIHATPSLDAQTMLLVDVALQGWAASTATEAYLLLEEGLCREACQLMENELPQFQLVSRRWADTLIQSDRPYLATAYRFSAPRFEEFIEPERVKRILAISPADQQLSERQIRRRQDDVVVEFEMSHNANLSDQWTHQQLAVAEYLDFLSELSARLESLKFFSEWCDRRGLKSSKVILPDRNDAPGLLVLPDQD